MNGLVFVVSLYTCNIFNIVIVCLSSDEKKNPKASNSSTYSNQVFLLLLKRKTKRGITRSALPEGKNVSKEDSPQQDTGLHSWILRKTRSKRQPNRSQTKKKLKFGFIHRKNTELCCHFMQRSEALNYRCSQHVSRQCPLEVKKNSCQNTETQPKGTGPAGSKH